MNKQKKSIAIYTDSLLGMGGGSRVALMLADLLRADIVTCEFNELLRQWIPVNVKIIQTGSFFKKINIPFFYFFETPLRFLFIKDLGYDINIFIGSSSIFAARRGKNNIWFCFTPNRIMYDLHDWKMVSSNFVNKIFLSLHVLIFKRIDQRIVKNNFKHIISQTQTVRKRVKKYYNRDSEVIFSPVDTSKFYFESIGNFFLTVSRLVPEKRIDLLVKSFNQMSEKKLVIAGNGPEKAKLLKLIGTNKNITIESGLNDKKLCDLYANCIATLYFPIDEDFGLIPIESMASGKPCIATQEGGCAETIVDGVTGFFVKPDVSSIVKKMKSLKSSELLEMKEKCINRAQQFDVTNFKRDWIAFLKRNYDYKL